MQSKFLKRTLSILLAVAMIVGLASGTILTSSRAYAADGKKNVSFTKVNNNGSGLYFATKEAANTFAENYIVDGNVRVSIVLDELSVMDKGFSTYNIAANTAAVNYSKGLRAKQDALAAKISNEVLGGAELDVVWNITISGNIISANVPFDKIEAIRNVAGVKKVVIETKYSPVADEVKMATSTSMTGTPALWAEGYTGAGSIVAIVDTGLDVEHEMFDAEAFEYALEETGKEVDLLTVDDIEAVIDQLHIAGEGRISGLTAEDLYISSKIPFGANYVDNDLDVTHKNDGQGEHGSHVTGISAGNRYIPDGEGGFVESVEAVGTVGQAPDAQIMVMKVFGKNGGAYDSDYVVAIEDAILLGADAVNLSLGSAAAGTAADELYADIFNSYADSDTVVAIASGNNSYWAEQTYYGDLYWDDVNYDTAGSPGSYAVALTVASVDNGGYSYMAVDIDGERYGYMLNESAGYGNDPMSTIAGEQEYVLIAGYGTDADFRAVAEELEGKVAVVSRGGNINFAVKINRAAQYGAIGCIVYNNQAGNFGMVLSGLETTIPAAAITQTAGSFLMEMGEQHTSGRVTYYTGYFTIGASGQGEAAMSSFSSWGVPGDLTLKPEISAPGGNIFSVNGDHGNVTGHDNYESMSGTSMATPQITGIAAVMGQYIRETGLAEKLDISPRKLINSLLMSTAAPQKDPLTASYYPVMQQGAGLVDVNSAAAAKSYITVDEVAETAPLSAAASIADGKVKVELGAFTDDAAYAVFSIHNYSDETVSYYLGAEFFTQNFEEFFRVTGTAPIYPILTWYVDDEEIAVADNMLYDFNGDGVANTLDAQRLLDYTIDYELDLNGLDYFADFDGDEDIDTYDARLAFELLGGAALEVEAGQTVQVVLEISNLEEELGVFEEINGNYLEGYIFAYEGDSEDGAMGVRHSIPVFGFYGDWSASSMFDKTGYTDVLNDEVVYPPYMYNADGSEALYRESFLIKYPDSSSIYLLGGNPMMEEDYLKDRNAVNADTMIKSAYYSLIRNAGAVRFYIENKYGKIVYEDELGAEYAAYYNPNNGRWFNTSSTNGLNFMPNIFKQGESFTLNIQAVPEYYIDEEGNVLWDEVSKEGTTYSLPVVYDNEAPFIVGAECDEDEDDGLVLVLSAHDDQYIAAVALYTEDGEYLGAYGSIPEIRKGEQVDYPFYLDEIFDGGEVAPHLLVEVYDYAANLSTYKINLNPEELEDPELSVVVEPEEAVIINGSSVKLSASVYPWGYEDETVFWYSLDEDVVAVDENGVVTSVYTGDEPVVTARVAACAAMDETAIGYADITVKTIHKDLNGLVWDEEGAIWVSEFDILDLPEYEKLTAEGDVPALVCNMAYGSDGVLYASSYDPDTDDGVWYSVDPETWTFTELGSAFVTDFCMAPSTSNAQRTLVYGSYGPYIMILNAATGAYTTYVDLSRYLNGAYVAGIAFEGQLSVQGRMRDYVLIVDTDGYLYEMAFYTRGSSVTNTAPVKVAKIGESVDVYYWQSLYYDAEEDNVYWSRFNKSDDYVELVMVNEFSSEDMTAASIGRFNDGVWPVGGLFELIEAEIETPGDTGDETGSIIGRYAGITSGVPTKSAEEFKRGLSLTNAASGSRPADEIKKTVTEVTVEIRADKLSKNGKIYVDIPDTAELVSAVGHTQYSSSALIDENEKVTLNPVIGTASAPIAAPASGETGEVSDDVTYTTYAFAFVDLEGIDVDEPILTLKFAMGSTGTLFITTEDINEDDRQQVIETVILGAASTYHAVHEYDAEWTWYTDDNGGLHADVVLTCSFGDSKLTFEDVDIREEVGEDTVAFVAYVEVDGIEYSDTYEDVVGIARINGRSANFGEELGVNFMLKIAEELLDEDAYVVVTFNGVDYEYLLSECVSGERYKITKSFDLKEYRDDMVLRVKNGEGNLITLYDKEGNNVTDTGYVFSMAAYLELAKESTNPKMVALAEAFEDYGTAAMIKFDYKADGLAVSDAVAEVTLEDLEDYAPVYGENNNLETLVSETAAVTYSAKLVLNKYFTFAKGTDVSAYKFYVDGKEVEPVKVSSVKYNVKVTGIEIKDYDHAYKFVVTDGTNSFEVDYSILSYSYKALESDKATQPMIALAQSTYLVYLAAEDYFA